MQVVAKQNGQQINLTIPLPRLTYLSSVMRKDCFEELWPLFKRAHDPAKELTESYAAYKKLYRYHKHAKLVLHVGDGAHCRTAALFAFMTPHDNISIDPVVNEDVCSQWRDRFSVRRFAWSKCRVEDYPLEALQAHEGGILVTFVHAHVDTDAVLRRLGNAWMAAYTCACCQPAKQLGVMDASEDGEDWCVLSGERQYKVLTNPNYRP